VASDGEGLDGAVQGGPEVEVTGSVEFPVRDAFVGNEAVSRVEVGITESGCGIELPGEGVASGVDGVLSGHAFLWLNEWNAGLLSRHDLRNSGYTFRFDRFMHEIRFFQVR